MLILLIFGAFILAAIIGLIYIYTRILRFFSYAKPDFFLSEVNCKIVSILPILCLVLYIVLDFINGIIVVVNLFLFWLLFDLLFAIIRKVRGKKEKHYWAGLLCILFCFAYLTYGWYNAHHVCQTEYTVETDKKLGRDSLRIVMISDAHLGSTFHYDAFLQYVEQIQRTSPDLVVITGDFVDDDSSSKDLIECCEALGQMQTTYGVFYVYGNHDKGYFSRRDFTDQDFRNVMRANNIRILEDEIYYINNTVCLIGRKDKSSERMAIDELTQSIPASQYTIVLDHQPNDFANEAAAGVDLVLSGHTHGGQMFPVGLTGEWSGANDKTYGMEVRDGTTFLVSSGISDWAIKYKTGGAISEYCVIDLKLK